MTTPPTAVLFDLDGTLLLTEQWSRTLWSALLRANGLAVTDGLLASFAGRRRRDVLAEIASWLTCASVDGLDAELDELAASTAPPPATVAPGAVELIGGLIRRVPVGVVTSGTRARVLRDLAAMGVLSLLAVVITCEDVARGKPAPDGYLLARRKLGPASERTVVFEDAPAGVTAAKAAGARCVGVTTTVPASALGAADLVVDSLARISWDMLDSLADTRSLFIFA